jgi:hypothetical protein
MRDLEVIDSELGLLLAIRPMAREAEGRTPNTARIDALLDERVAVSTLHSRRRAFAVRIEVAGLEVWARASRVDQQDIRGSRWTSMGAHHPRPHQSALRLASTTMPMLRARLLGMAFTVSYEHKGLPAQDECGDDDVYEFEQGGILKITTKASGNTSYFPPGVWYALTATQGHQPGPKRSGVRGFL